jgi:hypothetical protein
MVVFADSLRNPIRQNGGGGLSFRHDAGGLPHWRRIQSGYLSDFWRHVDVGFEVRRALPGSCVLLYELLQSAGRVRLAFWLQKGCRRRYEAIRSGYGFYVQPFFTLTMPQLSRICFPTVRHFAQAKENAACWGTQRACTRGGRSTGGCSGFFLSCTAHTTLTGVAYAVVQYYQVTVMRISWSRWVLRCSLRSPGVADLGVYSTGCPSELRHRTG